MVVLLQTFHIHLQSCKKHYVVEAYLSEESERGVSLKDVQSIRSYDDTRQHHTYDMGYFQLAHEHRSKQYDTQHGEEYPCGIGYW